MHAVSMARPAALGLAGLVLFGRLLLRPMMRSVVRGETQPFFTQNSFSPSTSFDQRSGRRAISHQPYANTAVQTMSAINGHATAMMEMSASRCISRRSPGARGSSRGRAA